MDPELTNSVGIFIGVAIGAVIVLVVILMIARRGLERDWKATQFQRDLLYDRLKNQGKLVHQFIATASNRLTKEREALEVLGRRQTTVAAGRNPPEKAAALIDLNVHLERLISIADSDPGLAGLSEYEALREQIEMAIADVVHAVATYNQTVDTNNNNASGFFGRLLCAPRAESFDASKKKRAGRL